MNHPAPSHAPPTTTATTNHPTTTPTTTTSTPPPHQVKELARAGMRNPASISVAVRSKHLPPSASSASSSSSSGSMAAGGGADAMGAGGGPGASAGPSWGVQATPTSLTNYYAIVEPDLKLKALVDFLVSHPADKVMVS